MVHSGSIGQVALESIVEAIRAGYIIGIAHRHHIDADTGGYIERPIVGRHTGDNGLLAQRPFLPYITVFYPDFRIGSSQRKVDVSILHEHSRMRLHLMVHDLTLIDNDILYIQRRGKQFAAGAIMIELTTRQRQDSYAQLIEFLVDNARIFTQCKTKLGIHIVEREFAIFVRTVHQEFYGTVAQQPDTDVHQEKMGFHQVAQFLDGRLLKHEVELVGIAAGGHEHTVVLCQVGIDPQTIAHDIGLGDVLQRFAGADIDIATGNQCMQFVRSLLHNPFVQRKLQGQQVLRQALSPRPTKDGYGCQDFSRRSITGQTTALTSGMQENTFLTRQPFA